jgi:hypothetical protein
MTKKEIIEQMRIRQSNYMHHCKVADRENDYWKQEAERLKKKVQELEEQAKASDKERWHWNWWADICQPIRHCSRAI